MTRKTKIIAIGIPLVLGMGVLTAFGAGKVTGLHGWQGLMKPDRIRQVIEWKIEDHLDAVDATPEQRDRIHEITGKLIDKGAALHGSLRPGHRALFEEWKSDSPDMDRITEQIDKAAELKAAFAKDIAESIVQIHDLLTPEQRAVITETIEEHIQSMQMFLNGR